MSGLVHVTYEVLDGVFIGAPHEQAVRKRFTRFQTNITGLFESGNLTGDNIAQGRQAQLHSVPYQLRGNILDAFVDTFGGGYVELALKLGVALNRIDTIIDFAAAAKYSEDGW